MENFLFYLLKSGIWIAAFWSVYWFFLRKETFFRFNRFFLLTGLPASFALAFCQYRYPVIVQAPIRLTDNPVEQAVQSVAASPFDWITLCAGIYAFVVITLIINYLIGLNKIRQIIHKQKTKSAQKPPIVDIKEIKSSFSAFGYVFLDTTSLFSEEEKRLIIAHENAHIEQNHWVDLFFVQVVCILQWFNPFIWLYRNAIKQNHEFLADRSVLQTGNSQAAYHAALINYTFKAPVFALTNSFAYYKFKRINMMKKNVSKPAKKLAVLLLVPALAVFLWAFAKPEYRYSTVNIPEKVAVTQDSVPQTGSPLIILNGKKLSGILPFDVATATEHDFAVALGVKADDIEEITVLKDKAAITVYGEDGKDGVITIKTKALADKEKVEKEKEDKSDDGIKITTDDGTIIADGALNSPLIFVDDKEVKVSLENINPEDIQSISILKGESAIDIYGERGKNGVILIITKQYAERTTSTPQVSTPLIVVDGKEKDMKPSFNFETASDDDFAAALGIKASDIEEITVLKNAASTQVYGEKGKNGVVIIRTKK